MNSEWAEKETCLILDILISHMELQFPTLYRLVQQIVLALNQGDLDPNPCWCTIHKSFLTKHLCSLAASLKNMEE